jgi:chromosome segregation ATPase
MAAQFDLSILATLQTKFKDLEDEIHSKKESLREKNQQLQAYIGEIQSIESQKLSLELEIGEEGKELVVLEETFKETSNQFSQVQKSASEILSMFQ